MPPNLPPESNNPPGDLLQAEIVPAADFLGDLSAAADDLALEAAPETATVTNIGTAIVSHFPPSTLRTRCIETLLSPAPQVHEPMNPTYALAALQRIARDTADASWILAVLIDRDARLVVKPEGLQVRLPLPYAGEGVELTDIELSDYFLAELVIRAKPGLGKNESLPLEARHLQHRRGALINYVGKLLTHSAVETARAAVCGDSPDLATAEAVATRWLKRCLGRTPTQGEIEVLCEWGHATKRQFFAADGEATEHPVFPIFLGPQGCGKTTSIRALTAPWGSLVTSVGLAEVSALEPKNISWADCAIAFVDEAQLPTRSTAALAALKHTLTETDVTCRLLHTNVKQRKQKRCAFIGASNAATSYDVLGGDGEAQRRFYFYRCNEHGGDAIEAEDRGGETYLLHAADTYEAFWSNLDHNIERLYTRTREERRARIAERNSTQRLGGLDAWLASKEARAPRANSQNVMMLTAMALGAALKREEGLSPSATSSRKISRELQSLGYEQHRLSVGRFYRVLQNEELFRSCLEAARKEGLAPINHLRWDESKPGSLPPSASTWGAENE